MKITRRFICLFLILALLIISTGVGFAKKDTETFQVLSTDGRTVNFSINSSLKGQISTEELTSIADSNNDTDNITILNVGYAFPTTKPIKSTDSETLSTLLTLISPPIKSYTGYDILESDRFMASCAKGEKKIVSKTISAKLSPSVSGTILDFTLGLNGEISYSITEGTELTGPSESSPYNSREYRCKFYQNKGKWTQLIIINGIDLSQSGTFTEPSKYISYSIDKIVH